MKFTYLIIDLSAVIVPFLFSFYPKINFFKNWKAFWQSNGFVSALFIAWDILYTHWGVWWFNPRYLTGIRFFNLPLEEILFFICIPYSCVFTYHCFGLLPKNRFLPEIDRAITPLLVLTLLLVGVLHLGRLYTSVTFIGMAAILLWLQYAAKATWLGLFYRVWLVLLIPFFIVNGLLTGTGLDEPVVLYNNSENLGIRLLTIPVEDVFYGMLLILLNVTLYERFQRPAA